MARAVGMKAFYRGYQIESEAGFVDASVCAGFNGALHKLRSIVMAHHKDFDLRKLLPDSTRGFESASTGHADIQKNQIGI